MADKFSKSFLSTIGDSTSGGSKLVKGSKALKAKASIGAKLSAANNDLTAVKDAMEFHLAQPARPQPDPYNFKKTAKKADSEPKKTNKKTNSSTVTIKADPDAQAKAREELITAIDLYKDIVKDYGIILDIPKITASTPIEKISTIYSDTEKAVNLYRSHSSIKGVFDNIILGVAATGDRGRRLAINMADPVRKRKYDLIIRQIFAKYHRWLTQGPEISLLLMLMEDVQLSAFNKIPDNVPKQVDPTQHTDL